MAKLNKFAFVALFLALVASCYAEPPRYRSTKRAQPQRLRFFARQEAAPAPTPYPSADELKPEIPFEEAAAPDQTYGPPDQTYGPPDQTYGPPDVTDNTVEQLPTDEEPEDFAPNPDAEDFAPAEETTETATPARLRQRTNKASKARLQAVRLNQRRKIERLVTAPAIGEAAPAPIVIPLQAQQLRLVTRPFAYTSQVQVW